MSNIKVSVIILIGVLTHSVCYSAVDFEGLLKTLQKAKGQCSVNAKLHVKETTVRNPDSPTLIEMAISADANEISIILPSNLPQVNLVKELNLRDMQTWVNYGPALRQSLYGLKCIKQVSEIYNGIPTQRLELQRTKKRNVMGLGSVTQSINVLLWISSDGYPVAGSFTTKTRMRVLLKKEGETEKREQKYARHADRLILIYDELTDMEKKLEMTITTEPLQ